MEVRPTHIDAGFLKTLVDYAYYAFVVPLIYLFKRQENIEDKLSDTSQKNNEVFITRKEYYRDWSQYEKLNDTRHKETIARFDILQKSIERMQDQLNTKADK